MRRGRGLSPGRPGYGSAHNAVGKPFLTCLLHSSREIVMANGLASTGTGCWGVWAGLVFNINHQSWNDYEKEQIERPDGPEVAQGEARPSPQQG
jgi:hypothetical protein